MTYFLILIGIVCTAGLCKKKIKISENKLLDVTNLYVVFWAMILIALCGLRSTTIGRDTTMYQYLFNTMSSEKTWHSAIANYSYIEYGYYFLEYVVSRFADYQVFILAAAILSIAPVSFIVYRYSENKMMSFVLYVCFTYYTFCMSGMRQAIAIGFIMLAYHCIQEKNLKCFLACILVAALFHSSALLFLPIYWIDKIPYKKPTIIVSIVAMVLAYLLRGTIWSIVTLFARQQYEANDAGGKLMYVFMILTVFLGFWYRRKFTGEDETNKVLLYLQVLSVVLWPVASINSAVARMYYYYHIFFILYVPALLKSINGKVEKVVITTGYLAVAIYFLVSQILPTSMAFNPYKFFWQ